MRINNLQRNGLDMAIQSIARDLDIDIYTIQDTFLTKNEPLEYGVNWGACGTQHVEETIKYANSMIKAAEIARVLNELQIITDYTDDPQDVDLDKFREDSYKLAKVLELMDADLVKLAIEKIGK